MCRRCWVQSWPCLLDSQVEMSGLVVRVQFREGVGARGAYLGVVSYRACQAMEGVRSPGVRCEREGF